MNNYFLKENSLLTSLADLNCIPSFQRPKSFYIQNLLRDGIKEVDKPSLKVSLGLRILLTFSVLGSERMNSNFFLNQQLDSSLKKNAYPLEISWHMFTSFSHQPYCCEYFVSRKINLLIN